MEQENTKPKEKEGFFQWLITNIGRLALSVAIPGMTFLILRAGFLFLRDNDAPQWVTAIVAILWGVGGIVAFFFIFNWLIEMLPPKWKRRFTPFVFVGPAMAILIWYLIVPVGRTIYLSLLDANSEVFVGLENYVYAFTNDAMVRAFRNNLIWLVLGTGSCIVFGMIIAVLADRAPAWIETLVKTLVFLPMAISMVGAGVIWLFVYSFRPRPPQIGLLNAILNFFGADPVPFMFNQPWNNVFLIIIMVWIQTGYAMVIFSAAIKGIPEELKEAARIDGANEFQVFFRIMIPYIRGTLVTVSTTIIIFTLKVFDIVFTMTGGNYGTEVVANQFYIQRWVAFQNGRGSAIAIVLLLMIIPVMIYNLVQFGSQTEAF